MGKVAGSFYRIVVDAQPAMLASAMLRAGLLYAASTVIYAATSWVTEALALRWRQRLTSHLHRQYCQHQHAYYFLQLPASQRRHQAGLWERQEELGQQQHGEEGDEQEEGSSVDNADQRIASDAAELCECLAAVARVAAAAPFKLLYYRQGQRDEVVVTRPVKTGSAAVCSTAAPISAEHATPVSAVR